jgi:Flp pilus assembly protein TadG
MRICARRWRMDQGNALVEFTFIAIMLVVVMLGIVEMGRMVLVYTTVANAARAGARYAIVHGADRTGTGANGPSGPSSSNTTQVKTVVNDFASAGLLNVSNLHIAVNYPNGTNTADSPVTVTVTYLYDPWVPYFSSLLSTTLGSTSEGVITF